MKAILTAAISISLLAVSCAAEGEIFLPEFKLQQGISEKVYKNLRSTKIEPDGVKFIHDGGVVKIGFEHLPEEIRVKCGFDPEKAAEYRNLLNKAAELDARKMEDERLAMIARENSAASPNANLAKLTPITGEHVKARWLTICNYFVNPLDRDVKLKTQERAKRIEFINSGLYDLRAQKFAHEYNAWLHRKKGDEEAARAEMEMMSNVTLEDSKRYKGVEVRALGAMLTNPFQLN